jgi:hypothetical protein
MNKYNKIVFVNGSAPPLNADNLNHMDEGIERAIDEAIALETEIATARGDSADLNTRFTADEASLEAVKSEITTARGSHNSLGARLNGIDSSVSNKADKSMVSQLSARMQTAEKALTGKANATDVANALKAKEDNSNKVSDSSQITDYTRNYPSIKYLTDNYWGSADSYSSDEVDILLNAKADNKSLNERLVRMDMSIGSKYDSSNIELGTATLTPYSTQIDKIKSATCLYEKIGDIVIVNVTVIMNATSLGGTSTIALLNMPFSNKSDVIVHDIGISKNGGMFRGSVNKSAWLQFTPLNKQAYNFVADEQVNFSLIYKI